MNFYKGISFALFFNGKKWVIDKAKFRARTAEKIQSELNLFSNKPDASQKKKTLEWRID